MVKNQKPKLDLYPQIIYKNEAFFHSTLPPCSFNPFVQVLPLGITEWKSSLSDRWRQLSLLLNFLLSCLNIPTLLTVPHRTSFPVASPSYLSSLWTFSSLLTPFLKFSAPNWILNSRWNMISAVYLIFMFWTSLLKHNPRIHHLFL